MIKDRKGVVRGLKQRAERRGRHWSLAAVAALAVAGCGAAHTHMNASAKESANAERHSFSSSTATSEASHAGHGTAARRGAVHGGASAPVPSLSENPGTAMEISSSAISHAKGEPIERRYTCDGEDRSPPIKWSGIPANAAELALFVINFKPVDGKLFFDWAVAGIDPRLKGLPAGRLPAGAVVGRNGFGKVGYSICPSGRRTESYVIVLFAPPRRLARRPGFEPVALHQRILQLAPKAGLLGASYARH